MRVVIDTNVVVSAVLRDRNPGVIGDGFTFYNFVEESLRCALFLG